MVPPVTHKTTRRRVTENVINSGVNLRIAGCKWCTGQNCTYRKANKYISGISIVPNLVQDLFESSCRGFVGVVVYKRD